MRLTVFLLFLGCVTQIDRCRSDDDSDGSEGWGGWRSGYRGEDRGDDDYSSDTRGSGARINPSRSFGQGDSGFSDYGPTSGFQPPERSPSFPNQDRNGYFPPALSTQGVSSPNVPTGSAYPHQYDDPSDDSDDLDDHVTQEGTHGRGRVPPTAQLTNEGDRDDSSSDDNGPSMHTTDQGVYPSHSDGDVGDDVGDDYSESVGTNGRSGPSQAQSTYDDGSSGVHNERNLQPSAQSVGPSYDDDDGADDDNDEDDSEGRYLPTTRQSSYDGDSGGAADTDSGRSVSPADQSTYLSGHDDNGDSSQQLPTSNQPTLDGSVPKPGGDESSESTYVPTSVQPTYQGNRGEDGQYASPSGQSFDRYASQPSPHGGRNGGQEPFATSGVSTAYPTRTDERGHSQGTSGMTRTGSGNTRFGGTGGNSDSRQLSDDSPIAHDRAVYNDGGTVSHDVSETGSDGGEVDDDEHGTDSDAHQGQAGSEGADDDDDSRTISGTFGGDPDRETSKEKDTLHDDLLSEEDETEMSRDDDDSYEEFYPNDSGKTADSGDEDSHDNGGGAVSDESGRVDSDEDGLGTVGIEGGGTGSRRCSQEDVSDCLGKLANFTPRILPMRSHSSLEEFCGDVSRMNRCFGGMLDLCGENVLYRVDVIKRSTRYICEQKREDFGEVYNCLTEISDRYTKCYITQEVREKDSPLIQRKCRPVENFEECVGLVTASECGEKAGDLVRTYYGQSSLNPPVNIETDIACPFLDTLEQAEMPQETKTALAIGLSVGAAAAVATGVIVAAVIGAKKRTQMQHYIMDEP